jgi:hypothetical protein
MYVKEEEQLRARLAGCLAYPSALKMEVVLFSQRSADFYQTAWSHFSGNNGSWFKIVRTPKVNIKGYIVTEHFEGKTLIEVLKTAYKVHCH